MSTIIVLYNTNLTAPTTVTIQPGVSALDFLNNSANNLACIILYGDRQSFQIPGNGATLTVFLSQLDIMVGHFIRNPINMLVTPDGTATGTVRIWGSDAKWRKFRKGVPTALGQQVAIPVTPSGEGGPPGSFGGMPF